MSNLCIYTIVSYFVTNAADWFTIYICKCYVFMQITYKQRYRPIMSVSMTLGTSTENPLYTVCLYWPIMSHSWQQFGSYTADSLARMLDMYAMHTQASRGPHVVSTRYRSSLCAMREGARHSWAPVFVCRQFAQKFHDVTVQTEAYAIVRPSINHPRWLYKTRLNIHQTVSLCSNLHHSSFLTPNFEQKLRWSHRSLSLPSINAVSITWNHF